jgi:hypothetical protein
MKSHEEKVGSIGAAAPRGGHARPSVLIGTLEDRIVKGSRGRS